MLKTQRLNEVYMRDLNIICIENNKYSKVRLALFATFGNYLTFKVGLFE